MREVANLLTRSHGPQRDRGCERFRVVEVFLYRLKPLFGTAVVALALLGCKSAISDAELKGVEEQALPASSAGIDMNDVSFLFPKKFGRGDSYPKITASALSRKDGQAIFPQGVFDDIFANLKSLATGDQSLLEAHRSRDLWQIQSFRVDPCAPSFYHGADQSEEAAHAATCLVQIRLILQPVRVLPGGGFTGKEHAADFAIHALYSVATGSVPAALIEGISALKAASPARTSGAPLGIHPGLLTELNAGPTTAFGDAVTDFVLSNVRAADISSIAVFEGANLDAEPWVMFEGTVASTLAGDWHWTVRPLVNAGSEPVMRLGGIAHFTATTTKADGKSMHDAKAQPNAPANPQVIHFIENPANANTQNMDCVSCHLSTSYGQRINVPPGPDRFRPKPGVTGYADEPFNGLWRGLQVGDKNFRNFGYFQTKASVSQRTVNETAEVVDFLNRKVLHVPNPGLDCSVGDVNGDVYQCVRAGGGPKCFDTCKQPQGGMPKPVRVNAWEEQVDFDDVAACQGLATAGVSGKVATEDGWLTFRMSPAVSGCFSQIIVGAADAKEVTMRCETSDACVVRVKNAPTGFVQQAEFETFTRVIRTVSNRFGMIDVTIPNNAKPAAHINCNWGNDNEPGSCAVTIVKP